MRLISGSEGCSIQFLFVCFADLYMTSSLHSLQLGFGDFFVTHRGYMQDKQMSFPRETVSTFGLLLADRIIGPFSLEIQYIKAIRTLVPTARESTLFY